MPDLYHCLKDHDLGFLQIIAQLWGLELSAGSAREALPLVKDQMLDRHLVTEITSALPAPAQEALEDLQRNKGVIPWSQLVRAYGGIREVGPGRRDREKPYLDPISATEMLWYRGLIGREFLKFRGELQECAYLPTDLSELLPPTRPAERQLPGRAASPGETAWIQPVSDRILDHTCTLLAALRLGDGQRSPSWDRWDVPYAFVYAILAGVKLITSSEQPVAEDARSLLACSRGEALPWLVQGWQKSVHFNELRLMSTIVCEGAWQNNPVATRLKVLTWLEDLPENTWWNLNAFIQGIKAIDPGFQRPTGDFDTWLIRDAETGQSLQGMAHWDAVDGALLRYMICGPLHWLGLVDLASPARDLPVAAFRLSSQASALLAGKPLPDSAEEDQPILVSPTGLLTAFPHTPRLARYQLARFCDWVAETTDQYNYQLSPSSLSLAINQGLKIAHLVLLIQKYGDSQPPNLLKALQHWESQGAEAKVQECVILRVTSPRILHALLESSAGRFLGDKLGPTAVIIQPGAVEKIRAALARLGYLSDLEGFTHEKGASDHGD